MNMHSDPSLQSSDGQEKAPASSSNRDAFSDKSRAGRGKELLVPRLMASVLSLIVIVMGGVAVLTAQYSARSTRLGGVEISLEGLPAIVMGISTILFGLVPLALWFRTKRNGIRWGIAWIVAAAAVFSLAVFLQHR